MKKTILIGNIIISALLLIAVIASLFIDMPVKRVLPDDSAPADTGWHYEDGSPADPIDVQYSDHTARLSKTLNAASLASFTLCFDTANVTFTVYLDGEPIYDYHPGLRPIYGTSYGLDLHSVSIPYFTGEKELLIEAEDMSCGSMWAGFRNMYFENGTAYMMKDIESNFGKSFLSFWIFTVGLLIVIFGLLMRQDDEQRLELISLGALAMILSLWTITGFYFPGMLTGNPGFIRAINYLTLMLMPLAGITLVACLTRQTGSRVLLVVMGVTFFNFGLHMAALFTGLKDYHDLLIISHFNFLLAVVLAIVLIARSVRRNTMNSSQQIYILVAFLILMGSGIIDLFLYYFKHNKDASTLSRFGLLIFVNMLALYELHEFIRVTEKNREMEVVRRLAYHDGLTGLENRMAFNEYEAQIGQMKSGRCLYVQLDINDLKKVNDNHGHAAGDDYIMAGAKAIVAGFGEYGRVFRVGGDEFVAILLFEDRREDPTAVYEKCKKHMIEQEAAYNEDSPFSFPLAIAYGMAVCELGADSLAATEILADKRMYERKKQMKA